MPLNRLSLVVFLALVVGAGWLIGWLTLPGAWYAALAKPPFNPPNWLFAPTWTVLYVLIAVAGWRVWESARGSRAMKLWIAQFGLNLLWSPTFFGAHSLWGGLAVIVLLLASILAFIGATWNRDRVAALCFLPYAAWVSFATLLNASLAVLNS